MATTTSIILDGDLSDWRATDRIDSGLGEGYSIYAKSDGGDFVFAMTAPMAIGANTTAWLNTDRNAIGADARGRRPRQRLPGGRSR